MNTPIGKAISRYLAGCDHDKPVHVDEIAAAVRWMLPDSPTDLGEVSEKLRAIAASGGPGAQIAVFQD